MLLLPQLEEDLAMLDQVAVVDGASARRAVGLAHVVLAHERAAQDRRLSGRLLAAQDDVILRRKLGARDEVERRRHARAGMPAETSTLSSAFSSWARKLGSVSCFATFSPPVTV